MLKTWMWNIGQILDWRRRWCWNKYEWELQRCLDEITSNYCLWQKKNPSIIYAIIILLDLIQKTNYSVEYGIKDAYAFI